MLPPGPASAQGDGREVRTVPSADGVPIQYEAAGLQQPGVPIVFVHGFSNNRSFWKPLGPRERRQGSRRAGGYRPLWTHYRLPPDPGALPEVRTLTYEAAEYLATLPVRAYGTDAFGADDFSGTRPMIHQSFLKRRIPIYEQLVNLDRLVGREGLFFVGVPLNMRAGDGMLVRPVVLAQ